MSDPKKDLTIIIVLYQERVELIKANKDVSGKETIIAAVQVYFFAISDTATIIIALIIVLRKKYIIYSHLFL